MWVEATLRNSGDVFIFLGFYMQYKVIKACLRYSPFCVAFLKHWAVVGGNSASTQTLGMNASKILRYEECHSLVESQEIDLDKGQGHMGHTGCHEAAS